MAGGVGFIPILRHILNEMQLPHSSNSYGPCFDIRLTSPQFYDNAEIRKITGLLLRMTTDPIIGDVKSLLGSTLAALMDAIPTHSWDTEVALRLSVKGQHTISIEAKILTQLYLLLHCHTRTSATVYARKR